MDVAAWLQSLGLERYVPAFRDDIDAEVLPSRTAEDLISIGVTSVGHRRKLLDAIVAFRAEAPTAAVTEAFRDVPEPPAAAAINTSASRSNLRSTTHPQGRNPKC